MASNRNYNGRHSSASHARTTSFAPDPDPGSQSVHHSRANSRHSHHHRHHKHHHGHHGRQREEQQQQQQQQHGISFITDPVADRSGPGRSRSRQQQHFVEDPDFDHLVVIDEKPFCKKSHHQVGRFSELQKRILLAVVSKCPKYSSFQIIGK
jgi:hypothetical protein